MRTAIIGAGIAGLRLAQRLARAGHAVRVFDKARGPSGRLATRRTDSAQFDHGAQYFTARDPRFLEHVESWLKNGVADEWRASIVELERGIYDAERRSQKRYVGTPRMSAIGRDLARGIPMELSSRILAVREEASTWAIDAEDGQRHVGFDLVLTAVPAPQATPLLAAAPALAERAEAARMLPCHALMVRFASDLAVPFDAAFVRSSGLAWVARNASKPGRASGASWVLHSTPDWSAAHLDTPSERVRDEMLGEFSDALGAALPDVSMASAHRWLHARAEGASASEALWDPELGLGACGDWVRGDRVEDAYVSAEELADAILEAPSTRGSKR